MTGTSGKNQALHPRRVSQGYLIRVNLGLSQASRPSADAVR